MKVGLYLVNPTAGGQSVAIGEIEDGETAKDFILKDVIGKGVNYLAEILGVNPMQVMTDPELNKFSLRLKLIPGIHEPCGKPWGECTCGTPGPRKLAQ